MPVITRAAVLLACVALSHAAVGPAEKLGRGLVAVRSAPQEVFLSWRLVGRGSAA